MSQKTCEWGKYVGLCGKPSKEGDIDGRCEEHSGLKCTGCGAPASHSCYVEYQFVCGYPICDFCTCGPRSCQHQPEFPFKPD